MTSSGACERLALAAIEPSVELDGLRGASKLRLDIADYDAVDAIR